MTIKEFEETVWRLEGIRLVVRETVDVQVDDYDYQNAANRTWSIAEWLRKRVEPCLPGSEFVVLDGQGVQPNRRTRLDTLRGSYAAE
tara:strand:+ start:1506 stop:1766 length:261 start_codon:yes stop_codon:yes gene_type:complete